MGHQIPQIPTRIGSDSIREIIKGKPVLIFHLLYLPWLTLTTGGPCKITKCQLAQASAKLFQRAYLVDIVDCHGDYMSEEHRRKVSEPFHAVRRIDLSTVNLNSELR